MEHARVRFASRCGGEASFRPRQCAGFHKHFVVMRSNRRSFAAAVRKWHVCALRARARPLSAHG
eukprot:5796977-Lingulodinium_polyedra.AAC.1